MARGQERFRFEKSPLGGGAFGLVYKAYDTELDRPVAIKVPHDGDKERALRSEAKVMARIQDLHEPHVVALYDLHEIDGRRVIVMEFVEGTSVRAKLGKIGEQHPLPPEVAVDITMQACQGLHTLHTAFQESGIFHRDVKPENILIRAADGLVKIADFGISRVLESSGIASTTTGTVPYMAPELLEGEGADFRADVYGLGVTLYEMLTGRLPFNPWDAAGRAKAPRNYMQEICQGHPPAPSDVASVDRELSEIALRAMHCDVRQRYQSAAALREALCAFHSRASLASAIAAARDLPDDAARERALADVVQRFPQCVEAHRNLAWLYNHQMRYAEAVRVLEQATALCPSSGELAFDLAMAYYQVRQAQRAIDALDRASRLSLPPELQRRVPLLLNVWRRGR